MACRESPLTKSDARFYKDESFRVTKDVHDTAGSGQGLTLLYHNAENDPVQQSQVPRQKMTESSWKMFEKEEEKAADFMTSAKKRGRCMFTASADLFGEKAFVP